MASSKARWLLCPSTSLKRSAPSSRRSSASCAHWWRRCEPKAKITWGFTGRWATTWYSSLSRSNCATRRREDRPDLHLFLPDELVVVDHRKEQARHYRYEFAADGVSTEDMERGTDAVPYVCGAASEITCDHVPGEYADKVREVIAGTERGDFFEVTPSQVLRRWLCGQPERPL